MSKTVALIIHARKDSTRCRNKHLRPLGDTTLIDIAIDKVNQLKNLNEIYIAAYDQELKDKAKGKVKVLEREYDSVAPGNAHHSIMYRHINDVKSDYIINYNPCQPFLDIDKIQSVIDWFISSPIESAITVKNTRNFYWNKDATPANFKPNDRLSTTAGPSLWEATHSLVMYKKEYMLLNWELFPNLYYEPYPYLIDWPEEELIDVDTELDFKLADLYYKDKNRHTVESWGKLQDKVLKDTLAIDFDGVIHKNSKGYYDGTVYDDPVDGAIEAIKELSKNYTIMLYTFKGHPERPSIQGKDGIQGTWEWLDKYGIKDCVKDIVWGKPNAKVYIDDKGYKFENWHDTLKYVYGSL
jgi:CMP-N-acetylneuraminic acid synthetase